MQLGMLTITNSIEMCDQSLFARSAFVILMDDEIRSVMEAKDATDIMSGSIILPPFSIMAVAVDNMVPYQEVEEMYLEYLHTKEPQQFITGIIAMLIKGINVIILLSSHEAEFGFIPAVIIRYFNIRYGINPYVDIDGVIESQFGWIPTDMYMDQMKEDLFIYDFMSANDLLLSWSDFDLTPEVVRKLIWVYNPAVQTGSMEEYASIFNSMKRNAKNNSSVPMMPFTSVEGQQ